MKIYVVMRTSGDDGSWEEAPIGAYYDEKAAEARVEKAQARADELFNGLVELFGRRAHHLPDLPKGSNEFDPDMQFAWGNPVRYSLCSAEIEGEPPGYYKIGYDATNLNLSTHAMVSK